MRDFICGGTLRDQMRLQREEVSTTKLEDCNKKSLEVLTE